MSWISKLGKCVFYFRQPIKKQQFVENLCCLINGGLGNGCQFSEFSFDPTYYEKDYMYIGFDQIYK